MNRKELVRALEGFTKNNDFALPRRLKPTGYRLRHSANAYNPDGGHVGGVIDGVLENERNSGLKLCPCKLRDGKRQRDLELLCPCNFKAQDT